MHPDRFREVEAFFSTGLALSIEDVYCLKACFITEEIGDLLYTTQKRLAISCIQHNVAMIYRECHKNSTQTSGRKNWESWLQMKESGVAEAIRSPLPLGLLAEINGLGLTQEGVQNMVGHKIIFLLKARV